MEKGNAVKPSTSDSKNKQDVNNKHLRLPRVKENLALRLDSKRKSNPQRSKEFFDKRPQNRNGVKYDRYRSEVTETVNEAICKSGGKKTNLNHLLNFTMPTLEDCGSSARRSTYNRLPKYNKELFLQANCQFVARDNENYAIYQKDPDKLVEWSLIEEIRLPCYEVPSCPICLDVPTAAKITRCGHVYCWPCILHYLALTDKSWQKCPICFEAVHKTDLKSVQLQLRKSFAVGDEITLCLMKREKGTLLSIPVLFVDPIQVICTVKNADAVTRYQKLLLTDQKGVFTILEREDKELKDAYEEQKDTIESCFVESARTMLSERKKILNLSINRSKEELNCSVFKHMNASGRKHLTSIRSMESCEDICVQMKENLEFKTSHQSSNGTSEKGEKRFTYFYQAEDGQHIYLHNINVRMLLEEYSSLEFSPQTITAKVVEIGRVSMTDVLRKRLRYLQHLPLTCEFNIVELDFSHVVSEEVLSKFRTEIKQRKQYRSKKARDERLREKRIEQEENKKLGKYPKATYNLNSTYQFPIYKPEDFLSLLPSKEDLAENVQLNNKYGSDDNSNSIGGTSDHCGIDGFSPDSKSTSGASFAQMLRVGPKNFSNVPKETKSAAVSQQNRDSDCEEDPSVPEFRQSFSDAIEMALNSVSLQDPISNQNTSKRKKKGKKQQLLFTTSMCRNK